MSSPRSLGNGWLLLATAALLVLLSQRQRHTLAVTRPASPLPTADPDVPAAAPRGPSASSPLQIPSRGWKDVLWRTLQRTNDDRLLANAGGVVFFGLLAIFPAITALVSSYGLFADNSTIAANLERLALMLPAGSFQIVQDQVARVLAKGNTSLGITFLLGLLFAIWSANSGVKSVIDALNAAYEERETRSFVRLNLVALALTTGALVAIMVMISAVVAFPLALDRIGLAPDSQLILGLLRWPILFIVLLVALGVLYRFGPSRCPPRWRWFSVGAITAVLLWIAGSALLSWYLANFGNYDATYGSLGAAIGLMTWMWMSAIVVLFGAELNSEIERQAAALR
ncbi:MAG: YihY/virulence factor BrkB family protein [Bradyrhizobium sp.]|uniref:YihY/virulence factor BrkB family protein n=1 Tax=Bradyrhizobium sp. TaxID=376 RepID=UPI001D87560C|nr:YihY/virulence factor BrkB family protein [Bradyrhizobium sp.]MBV9564776.1 YihY/virulence factor BrkB family protein [Bradyrhizobium sp.]